jgi:DNA ligase D-like protein (predicted ligase)
MNKSVRRHSRGQRHAGSPPKSHPTFIEPMIAKIVQALPEGEQWSYEVKFDGYRALIIKDGERVQIRSRNNNDLTRTYPTVAAAATRLRADSAMLDGEIVAVDHDGRPSFQALQHRAALGGHTIVFYAFDLVHLDGEELTREPLVERQRRLRKVVAGSGILLSSPLSGSARQVIDAVQRLGLEGVIAKRKDSKYQPGLRTQAWLKLKLDKQQEFVIGGYRPGNHGIDALLVGVYEGRELHFSAKVRAGFTPLIRRSVFERLKPLRAPRCPFVDLPRGGSGRWGGGVPEEEMAEMRWGQTEVGGAGAVRRVDGRRCPSPSRVPRGAGKQEGEERFERGLSDPPIRRQFSIGSNESKQRVRIGIRASALN